MYASLQPTIYVNNKWIQTTRFIWQFSVLYAHLINFIEIGWVVLKMKHMKPDILLFASYQKTISFWYVLITCDVLELSLSLTHVVD
jgi:hypothetical protein